MTAEHPTCEHAGRVRPVVWEVSSFGDSETPVTVVCARCWKVVAATATAHDHYQEEEDGWYMPWPADA